MTSVRTLAAHDLVALRYPREPTPRDALAIAIGRAIDRSLAEMSHLAADGRRPTQSGLLRYGTEQLDLALEEVEEIPAAEVRARMLEELAGSIRAFRQSELLGLRRPRSRLVLIGERAGYFAQPDFWDGRNRFFEMKSYRAVPPPPDVALQLQLFQLAYPKFVGILVCFDRHRSPVETVRFPVPELSASESDDLLRFAYRSAAEQGEEKVLEYLLQPVVRYPFPRDPEAPGPEGPAPGGRLTESSKV
ncbi:MAG: hypothetical protein L3K11_03230 [Thermoplasmata archaeon]|nr:hypothetical protein [Thermoplasmata archaeon]